MRDTRSRPSLLQGLMENSSNVVELRDGVISILIAGIDSVATLLSTTFWLLAQDERIYQKLRTSVLDTIGQELPSYDQLKSLAYLRYVFNEGQLHPLVEPPQTLLTLPLLDSDDSIPACSVQCQGGKQRYYTTLWRRHKRYLEHPGEEGPKSGVLFMGQSSEF